MSEALTIKSPSFVINTIDDLVNAVKTYYPNADFDFLRRAYTFSEKAHEGQIRRSGEPYISHPLGVAGILAELQIRTYFESQNRKTYLIRESV